MAEDIERLLEERRWLVALARSLVAGDAAEDLAQEAWLAARASRHPASGRSRAWLSGILRNLARMHWRRERRLRERERRHGAGRGAGPSPVPPPDELLSRVEQQQLVLEAVAALEEPYREAVLVRYFQDLTPVEMAAQLGLPIATVKTRLRRALALLREALDRHHGGDRRRWQLAFLPWAFPNGPAAPGGEGSTDLAGAAGGETAGGGIMTLSAKSACAVAALIVVGAGIGQFLVLGTRDRRATDGRSVAYDAGRSGDGARTAPTETEPAGGNATKMLLQTLGGRLCHHITGAGIEGGTVAVLLENGAVGEATSDASGAFEVALSTPFRTSLAARASQLELRARAAGFVPVVRQVSFDAARVALGDVALMPGLEVHGIVVDPSGSPVSAGEVVATAALERQPIHPPGRERTAGFTLSGPGDALPRAEVGADGRFALALVGDWTGIFAIAPGFAPGASAPFLLEDAGDGEIRITLSPGATLEGDVVDPEGRPAGGATIAVTLAAHGIPGAEVYAELPIVRTTQSDLEGRFRFADMPPCYRDLSAMLGSAAGRYGSPGGLHSAATRVTLVLEVATSADRTRDAAGGIDAESSGSAQAMHALEVVVEGAGAGPVAGAEVAASAAQPLLGYSSRTVATDSAGRATLEVPAGIPCRVTVSADGYRTFSETIEPRDRIEIALEPLVAVRGRVLDGSGRPVAGARVYVESASLDYNSYSVSFEDALFSSDLCAWSDREGCFLLRKARSEIGPRLMVVSSRHGREVVSLAEPLREELTVTLEPHASVAGRVVDENGAAIPGAAVYLQASVRNVWNTRAAVTTDGVGSFRLPLAPCEEVRLEVWAAGFGSTGSQTFRVAPGASLEDVTVRLSAGTLLRTRLAHHDGAPAGGVGVWVTSAGPSSGERFRSWCTTDPDGDLALTVPRGGFLLGVDAFVPQLVLEAESVEELAGEVRLPAPAVLCLDFGGAAPRAPEVTVELKNAAGSTTSIRGRTLRSEDGMWYVDRIAPGSYEVSVRMSGGIETPAAPVTFRAGETSRIEVAAGRLVDRVLSVVDEAGSPVAWADVSLRAAPLEADKWIGKTGADGRYEFSTIAAYTGAITVVASGYAPSHEEVTLSGDSGPVTIVLRRGATLRVVAGAWIDGDTWVELKGSPAHAALRRRYSVQVTTWSGTRPVTAAHVRGGEATFEHVPAGTVEVSLNTRVRLATRTVGVPESGSVTVDFGAPRVAWSATVRHEGSAIESGWLRLHNRDQEGEARIAGGVAEGGLDAPGEHWIRLETGDEPSVVLGLGRRRIEHGTHLDFEISGGPVELGLLLPDGTPASGIAGSVRAWRLDAAEHVSGRFSSEPDGRVTFPFLPPGVYDVDFMTAPSGAFPEGLRFTVERVGAKVEHRFRPGGELRVRFEGDFVPRFPKFLCDGIAAKDTLVSDRIVRTPHVVAWPAGRTIGAVLAEDVALEAFEVDMSAERAEIVLRATRGAKVSVRLGRHDANGLGYRIEPTLPDRLHPALRDRVAGEFGYEGIDGVTLLPGRYTFSTTLPDGRTVARPLDLVLGRPAEVDFAEEKE